jgi:hypothetical protein
MVCEEAYGQVEDRRDIYFGVVIANTVVLGLLLIYSNLHASRFAVSD